MDLAARPLELPADDPWRLCDAGSLSADRQPQSAGTFEPDLVHGVKHAVHAAIMAVQVLFVYPEHMGHLGGDVPALLVVALLLGFLTPRGAAAKLAR